MGSSLGDTTGQINEQQLNEELRELVRPALAARVESLIEELWQDEELWENLRERFEELDLYGGYYPALREHLSALSDEQKDAFLKRAGMEAMRSLAPPRRQPWDEDDFEGDMYTYRKALYGRMASFDANRLSDFAEKWLTELARVGYRGMVTISMKDGTYKLPAKEQADPTWADLVSRPLGVNGGEEYPVLFENSRQVLWLHFQSKGLFTHGYREIRVSDKPLRTDKAILAALTVLEGEEVNLKELREGLEDPALSLDESIFRQALEVSDSINRVFDHAHLLEYVFLLLRYHRPGFDDLPREERVNLIVQTCSHINTFLEASRKLTAFLEYGAPDRRQKPATKDADRDVRAAVLKDVSNLTHREIGEELFIPLPDNFDYKGDHPTVRQMVKRGRNILERGFGKQGWQERIEAMRAEAKRWNSLTEVEQEAESMAERWAMPYEEALRLAEEKVAYIKRRRAENQPETG